jgi:hypothetical protein
MQFIEPDLLSGEFRAYQVWPDGTRRQLVTEHNQIQYAGANLLAKALAGNTTTMYKVVDIALGPASTPPPAGPALKSAANPPFAYSRYASSQNEGGFQATPSISPVGVQSVVCTGMFTGSSSTYYEFALLLNDTSTLSNRMALAYWYTSTGISWGIGTYLEIVWTLHFGVS